MNKPLCCVALWAILEAASPALLAQPDRISTRIDSSQTVVLTGRVPRQATAQNDAGPVDASFRLAAITLMLKTSPAQQADLNQLLMAQQDSTSPSYRQWLTPEQYADRFGVSTGDLAKITAWLESQGFTVGYTARGRSFLSFSGTAQQVANAFHTQIHRYNVNGVTHYANATDPSIPAALAGMVSAIRGLNDFKQKPHYRTAQPQITVRGYGNVVGPDDFAAIYDVAKLYNSSPSITGAGQKIAIVGQSEIHTSDITSFRNAFGLGAPNLDLVLVPGALGGGNPGYSAGDQAESDLDVEWSGAVAKGATVVFVYAANGVGASEMYAIDQNLAPVLSTSYGFCEEGEGLPEMAPTQAQAQQANAEGITLLAAQGDTGAADCDGEPPDNFPPAVAEGGLAVDSPGSTPEYTSMGGSEFNEGSGIYWVNGSATAYIPEMVWNDSAVSIEYGGGLAGGGGGASVYFTRPPWQSNLGLNDGMRHVPDLSLASSPYHDPLYLYTSDYVDVGASQPATVIGGTSCAAPTMAGIVALINQYLVSSGAIKQAGLGNINPTLYRLAQTQSNAFHDIVTGNNIVPCADTPDCVNGSLGWSAGPGYDSASGLGSVDAYNLAHAWSTALATQAEVVPSLDSNPEFDTGPGSNVWTFTLTLTEEAGFATTVTGLTVNGVNLTSQIQSLFGTTTIAANGSISGTYSLRNLNVSSGPVNVVFNISGGSGSATWNTTLTVPFTGPEPLLAIGGISNAASGQQTFAPGMLVSVYGTGMGSYAQDITVTPLVEYADGVEAFVSWGPDYADGGYGTPLLYVSPTQVNLQIPYETPAGPAQLLLGSPWSVNGVTYNFTVSSAAPGIFSYASTNGGASSPIGTASASVGGQVAIYVTGVGQITPLPNPGDGNLPDGYTPSPGTVPEPVLPVAVTVGGVEVTNFTYKGIPSWSVGVMQLNFTVPNGVAAGQQPVVVTVGGVPSLPANIAITQ